ncbi:MAG TPA: helix-turn-helix domain-containing protein, partial [Candidatus Thermoplasmatota archaeon]
SSSFVVTVQKDVDRPLPIAREVGEFPTTFNDLESRTFHDTVTLSVIQEVWAKVLDDGWSKGTANFVKWGYEYTAPGAECPSPPSCTPTNEGVASWFDTPVTMLFGHASPSASTRSVATDTGLGSVQLDSYIHVSIGGTPRHSGHAHNLIAFDPLSASSSSPLQPAEKASPPVAAWLGVGEGVIVATSLLAAFLTLYFFPLLKETGVKVALAVTAYAKLHKKELLNNQYRDRITTLVRAEPGITPSEHQTALGGDFKTIVYHLRVLERNKMVSSLVDGRHRRFFPTEQVSWGERGRLAALRNTKTRELYSLLLEEPGLAPKEISQRIGLSRPTVYWHVDRLERVGLVAHDKEAGRARFYPSDPNFRLAGDEAPGAEFA